MSSETIGEGLTRDDVHRLAGPGWSRRSPSPEIEASRQAWAAQREAEYEAMVRKNRAALWRLSWPILATLLILGLAALFIARH